MKRTRLLTVSALLLLLALGPLTESAFCQKHIKELDLLRTSMGDLGNKMPPLIKSAESRNLRTLERVFEINTYALTTIESYFKMIKIVISSDGSINKEVIGILNAWLEFINKYAQADVKYLDEALTDTKEENVLEIIRTAKKNMLNLVTLSEKAIVENKELVK